MSHSVQNQPAHQPPARQRHRGRPRKYASGAERSRAYRVRVKERRAALEAIAAAAGNPAPPLTLDPERAAAAIQFLDSLLNGDAPQQRRAWEDLEEVLGENRPSYRKLAP